MKKLFKNYFKTFSGLSTQVWWLALITLINRSGTMVIPFLSLYLTQSLNFTLTQVGWIMSAFGLGSVVGSWVGGKLADKVGNYPVMVASLIFSGFLFVLLQFVTTFTGFCVSIFFLMLVADTFRPAMFVALSSYSKPENKTRSVTLIRLAINLGFSAGPAIGGFIIVNMGYNGLFWLDGITCVLAGILLLKVLHPKKAKVIDDYVNENPKSVYKDKVFWIFLIAMTLFGIVFMQYFSTIPYYYKVGLSMTEFEIGLVMALNGFLIFLLEMPLIKWLEDTKYTKVGLMIFGLILLALSILMLNLAVHFMIAVLIGILMMTLGEMIAFPFSNSFAMERSKRGKPGEYMALYTVAFSVSHIFGHNSGMQLIDTLGFETTWYITFGISVLGILFLIGLKRGLSQET